eukprot:15506863-Heterocapsa_arctica.AAC.1
MEEAKEAILEELHLDLHFMVSPKLKADRNFNISGHGARSRSTARKTRLQVLQEVRHQGHSKFPANDG